MGVVSSVSAMSEPSRRAALPVRLWLRSGRLRCCYAARRLWRPDTLSQTRRGRRGVCGAAGGYKSGAVRWRRGIGSGGGSEGSYMRDGDGLLVGEISEMF